MPSLSASADTLSQSFIRSIAMAMERMKDWLSVSALADKLGIHRTVLYH